MSNISVFPGTNKLDDAFYPIPFFLTQILSYTITTSVTNYFLNVPQRDTFPLAVSESGNGSVDHICRVSEQHDHLGRTLFLLLLFFPTTITTTTFTSASHQQQQSM